MRPFVEVEIKGKKLNAVLDTGAWYSYARKELVKDYPRFPIAPKTVKLGGKTYKFQDQIVIFGKVKDSKGIEYDFSGFFFPVDELGEEAGRCIDIVFGSLILQDWGTRIDNSVSPPNIDFWRLRKGELVEL